LGSDLERRSRYKVSLTGKSQIGFWVNRGGSSSDSGGRVVVVVVVVAAVVVVEVVVTMVKGWLVE